MDFLFEEINILTGFYISVYLIYFTAFTDLPDLLIPCDVYFLEFLWKIH